MRRFSSVTFLFGLAAVLAVLFAALAVDVTHHGRLQQFDRVVAQEIYTRVDDPNLWLGIVLTGWGSSAATVPTALLGALGLLYRRRWHLLGFWALTLLGVLVLCPLLKRTMDIPRPTEFARLIVYRIASNYNFTFPSGHTMAALVVWGAAAYVLAELYPFRGAKMAVSLAGAGIVLMVSAGLLYVGVHYLTDILGAYLAGGAWLTFCMGLMHWRQPHRAPKV